MNRAIIFTLVSTCAYGMLQSAAIPMERGPKYLNEIKQDIENTEFSLIAKFEEEGPELTKARLAVLSHKVDELLGAMIELQKQLKVTDLPSQRRKDLQRRLRAIEEYATPPRAMGKRTHRKRQA